MSEAEQSQVAMVIMAHPDDAEFGSAGTTAKWVRDGWDVYYVVCTDGTGGGPDEATDVGPEARQALKDTRMVEQRKAGEVLGLKEVIFLEQPDGRLESTLELRRELVRLLRTYRPSRVICPSPERVWHPAYHVKRHHPDHLACGTASLAALYPASQNPWDFPELLTQGLQPHKVAEFYIVGAPAINHVEDISCTVDVKLDALAQHVSQLGEDNSELRENMKKMMAQRGEEHGYEFAEAFLRVENE